MAVVGYLTLIAGLILWEPVITPIPMPVLAAIVEIKPQRNTLPIFV